MSDKMNEIDRILEGAIGPYFDIEHDHCIALDRDGNWVYDHEISFDESLLFWNKDTGGYNELVDNGVDPYLVRYDGGIRGFRNARKILADYLKSHGCDNRLIETLMKEI